MVVVTLVFVFILLMMIGVPVVFSMGATSLLAGVFFWGGDAIPLATFAQRMLSGMNSFTMLSVPLFLLAGRLMNEGEITNKLFNTRRVLPHKASRDIRVTAAVNRQDRCSRIRSVHDKGRPSR